MEKISAYLVNAPNVWNTCLRILRNRGYALSVTCNAPEGLEEVERRRHVTWLAQKNGYQLVAKNPIELLGLAGVYEFKQPNTSEAYWWQVAGEDILEELYSSIGLSFRGRANQKPET